LVIEIQLGLMEIPTSGIRVTVAESVGCMELAALTVTVLSAVMEAGAVYFPDVVTLPELGLIDQVYSLATPLVTENDSVWDGFSVIVAGVIDCACKAATVVKSIIAVRSPFIARIGIVCRLHNNRNIVSPQLGPVFPNLWFTRRFKSCSACLRVYLVGN